MPLILSRFISNNDLLFSTLFFFSIFFSILLPSSPLLVSIQFSIVNTALYSLLFCSILSSCFSILFYTLISILFYSPFYYFLFRSPFCCTALYSILFNNKYLRVGLQFYPHPQKNKSPNSVLYFSLFFIPHIMLFCLTANTQYI